MNVTILQACDGFSILLIDSDGNEEYHRFSQEDTVEGLVTVFAKLGIEAKFEEDY
jgi:hypothetical protein